MKSFIAGILFLMAAHLAVGKDPFGKRKERGQIHSRQIDEASGLASSRYHHTTLYTHNDGGDSARIFAINKQSGKKTAEFTINGTVNNDWEDIAIGPCADDCAKKACHPDIRPLQHCIYIADIGDNGGHGAANNIYMVREPHILEDGDLEVIDTLEFSWPEENAESLMVDPYGGLYIVSKVKGGAAKMAALPAKGWQERTEIDMSEAVDLDIHTHHRDPLGGDISPYGTELVLISHNKFYYFYTPERNYLQVVNTTKPTTVDSYQQESKTEGICFSYDGSGVYMIREGKYKHLYYYPKIDDIDIL